MVSLHFFCYNRHKKLYVSNFTYYLEVLRASKDLIEKFSIPEENIYNMDENGIQLGISAQVLALVDCDQKIVQHVEDGNRELVTIIEFIAADGIRLVLPLARL